MFSVTGGVVVSVVVAGAAFSLAARLLAVSTSCLLSVGAVDEDVLNERVLLLWADVTKDAAGLRVVVLAVMVAMVFSVAAVATASYPTVGTVSGCGSVAVCLLASSSSVAAVTCPDAICVK